VKRLPMMSPYRDYVESGALLGYAVDLAELLQESSMPAFASACSNTEIAELNRHESEP
jgi:hypothetical protein